MNSLILVRHGNTFNSGKEATWVGRNEDLPLVESGHEQARAIASAVAECGFNSIRIYSSPLKRAKETASQLEGDIEILSELNEIDYGNWGGKSTEELLAMGLKDEIASWDREAIIPEEGWGSTPHELTIQISTFLDRCREELGESPIVAITSNGFLKLLAKQVLSDFPKLCEEGRLKVKTGHLCELRLSNGNWEVASWGVSPKEWAGERG